MNGFITESVSKLYDGFGTSLFLLGLVFSTRLMNLIFNKYFGYPGLFIFSLILLLIGILLLARGVVRDLDENKQATYGLSAGVLLWQAPAFLHLTNELGLFNSFAIMAFGLVALFLILFWRRINLVAIRFFGLVFLGMWGGSFLISNGEFMHGWNTPQVFMFFAVRLASLAGILVFTWWIIFRSSNSMQRKVSAIGLAFCAMLAGLWF